MNWKMTEQERDDFNVAKLKEARNILQKIYFTPGTGCYKDQYLDWRRACKAIQRMIASIEKKYGIVRDEDE